MKFFKYQIGSGFDINSCLLGSHIFQRTEFDTTIIRSDVNQVLTIEKEDILKYQNLLTTTQNYFNNLIRIPNSFFNQKLLYFIVTIEKGTNTRNFVKKIMEYANKNKIEKLFDDKYFQELNYTNETLINFILNKST